MNRKKLVHFILCVFFTTLIILTRSSKDQAILSAKESLTPLERSFLTTGAQLENISVSGWVRVKPESADVQHLDDLAIKITKELSDPASVITCKTSKENNQATIKASSKSSTQYTSATVQVLKDQTNNPEIYLVINIEKNEGFGIIKDLEKQILNILYKNGNQFTITTCLSGWVSGKLEKEKMHKLAQQAFAGVNGRIVEGVSTPQFISYAGITEEIERSVNVGKNRLNLNIAMRHNNTEDRTYITAATPVITHEY